MSDALKSGLPSLVSGWVRVELWASPSGLIAATSPDDEGLLCCAVNPVEVLKAVLTLFDVFAMFIGMASAVSMI